MTKNSNPERNEWYFRFADKQSAIDLIKSIADCYGSSVIENTAECSTMIYLPVRGEVCARMRRAGETHHLCTVALSQGCDRASNECRWDVSVKGYACLNGRLESKYTIAKYWL